MYIYSTVSSYMIYKFIKKFSKLFSSGFKMLDKLGTWRPKTKDHPLGRSFLKNHAKTPL